MSVIAVAFSRRRTATGTVHPAHTPSAHRWSLAALSGALGHSTASEGVVGALHGVGVTFCLHPAPFFS